MSFTTPTTTNTPVELTSGEKSTWRSEMEVPSIVELDAVEVKANTGISNAATADAKAVAAQSTADAACPDTEAIKTTGAQSKSGILTFLNIPEINVPTGPSGNQIPNMAAVQNAINVAIPSGSWVSLTLINGWGGTAKYRKIGDYLEIWFSLIGSSATNAQFAAIASSSSWPDHSMSFALAYPTDSYLLINSTGTLHIVGYTTSTTVGTFKMIRLAP